jgi:glyoxylase-like metal-dependent hydrolase (beta-lactamase superfamily II)/rhodanese-related sulfurtransferase
MIFHQFLNDDLGCAAYLVGDEEAKIAAIVDPPFDIDPLLEEAERRGLRIVRTVETHTHADHVSGHGRLALEHGVPVSVHEAAGVDYPNDPMRDGEDIEIGSVTLRVIHTPGHRPEHCCLAVIDRSRGDEPWLVLTGDSLFVGDAARPDLAVGAQEGAEGLFHSLRRLLELEDGVEVFPGHVSGSLCGKSMSSKGSTTIGFERRFNPILQIADVDAFVADSASIRAPKPPNLQRIVETNRGPFVGLPPLAQELVAPPDDAQLLDVRPVDVHLAGHRRGAVNVPVSGKSFSTKAGFVLEPGRPVCVLADSFHEAQQALRGLHSIAYFDIAGYVLGGGEERTEGVPMGELDDVLAAGVEVVDVREEEDRETGYIPGSHSLPFHRVATAEPDVPADRPLVTICESGPRAAIAASVLRARGYDARPVVDGGMADWRARGDTLAHSS